MPTPIQAKAYYLLLKHRGLTKHQEGGQQIASWLSDILSPRVASSKDARLRAKDSGFFYLPVISSYKELIDLMNALRNKNDKRDIIRSIIRLLNDKQKREFFNAVAIEVAKSKATLSSVLREDGDTLAQIAAVITEESSEIKHTVLSITPEFNKIHLVIQQDIYQDKEKIVRFIDRDSILSHAKKMENILSNDALTKIKAIIDSKIIPFLLEQANWPNITKQLLVDFHQLLSLKEGPWYTKQNQLFQQYCTNNPEIIEKGVDIAKQHYFRKFIYEREFGLVRMRFMDRLISHNLGS